MGKRGITPLHAKQLREKKGLVDTKLQRIRVKKGLSQSELAAISGVSKRTIQSYEHNTTNIENARFKTLCKLCISLNCKIEDIIENKDLIHKFRMVK